MFLDPKLYFILVVYISCGRDKKKISATWSGLMLQFREQYKSNSFCHTR